MTHRKSVPQCILHQVEDIWRKPPFIQGAHDPCDLLGNFPMCNTVWAPGPVWNPNQKKKSGWNQRDQQKSGFKGCLCATWQQWDQVGRLEILKKEKHSPLGSNNYRRKVFPEETIHSQLALLFYKTVGLCQCPHIFPRRERWPDLLWTSSLYWKCLCSCGQPPLPTFPEGWFHHAGPED